jgi:hypothetical protein
MVTERENCLNLQVNIFVNENEEKLITFNLTLILINYLYDKSLHRNDRFVTLDNKFSLKSHCRLQCTCNSCIEIACCSSQLIFTFLYAGSSIQSVRARDSPYVYTCFCKTSLFIQPHQKKKHIIRGYI